MRPVKRSFTIAGHRTSISLEAPVLGCAEGAAAEERVPLSQLIARIDAARGSERAVERGAGVDARPLARHARRQAGRTELAASAHSSPVWRHGHWAAGRMGVTGGRQPRIGCSAQAFRLAAAARLVEPGAGAPAPPRRAPSCVRTVRARAPRCRCAAPSADSAATGPRYWTITAGSAAFSSICRWRACARGATRCRRPASSDPGWRCPWRGPRPSR